MNNDMFREMLYTRTISQYIKDIVLVFADIDVNFSFDYIIIKSNNKSSIKIKKLLISKNTIINFLKQIDSITYDSEIKQYSVFQYIDTMVNNIIESLSSLMISIEIYKNKLSEILKDKDTGIIKLHCDAINLIISTNKIKYIQNLNNKILYDIFILFNDAIDIIHQFRLTHYSFDYYILYYNTINTKKFKIYLRHNFTLEVFKCKTIELLSKATCLLDIYWCDYIEENIIFMQIQNIINDINFNIKVLKKYKDINKIKILKNKILILNKLLPYLINIDYRLSLISKYLIPYNMYAMVAERIQVL